jgi:hypothetical protein
VSKEIPLVVGAANVGDAPVGGEDDHGRGLALERAVEEGEALHVEHVHFVDEQHAGHDFRLALLPPLRHLLVDLLPHLLRYLPSRPGKQSQKALRPRVDHVDLVQGHRVHHLLALLYLPLGTIHESRLRTHRVVV